MPPRRCLGCGRLTNRYRCAVCLRRQGAIRDAHRPLAKAVVSGATHCAICGNPPTPEDRLTLEHIVPLSKGGTSEPANLAAVHFSCNARKRDRRANARTEEAR